MIGMRLEETVNFREDPGILKIVDEIAVTKGTDRSALYREAIRFWLRHEQSTSRRRVELIEVPEPWLGRHAQHSAQSRLLSENALHGFVCRSCLIQTIVE
jgi:hypothetical protein